MKIQYVLSVLLFTIGLLAGCGGGGGSSSAPAASILSGTAAVGSPIVGGTINITCAAGSALAPASTNSTGYWQVTLSGQTLPCAVQVSGGVVNGTTIPTLRYHSIASSTGNVNITPLTDLLVANLASTATPSTWFTGLLASQLATATYNQASVDASLAKLRVALSQLTPLNNSTINPITTVFTPHPGVLSDDVLAALATALSTSTTPYATLLANAAASAFTAPAANFGTALTNAFNGTASGGATASPAAPPGISAVANSASQISINWVNVSGATGYNIYRSTSPIVQIIPGNKITNTPITAPPYPNTGLAAATAYYYKVTAVNAAGESVGSSEVTVTTPVAGVANISATANTTAQNLTVGTMMASFSPLTASGGTPPYSYSVTGTLPAGLSLNTSTGAVTGTPTAIYAAANLVFSVKDAGNVTAATTSTVGFTVTGGSSVGGSVSFSGNGTTAAGTSFTPIAAKTTTTGNNGSLTLTWGSGLAPTLQVLVGAAGNVTNVAYRIPLAGAYWSAPDSNLGAAVVAPTGVTYNAVNSTVTFLNTSLTQAVTAVGAVPTTLTLNGTLN